nr:hypothetical protein CFP56_20285 [Quercus suber]
MTPIRVESKHTYAKTFENSEDGDMTKLSLVADHDIKCCMLESSSMLDKNVSGYRSVCPQEDGLIELVYKGCLDNLRVLSSSGSTNGVSMTSIDMVMLIGSWRMLVRHPVTIGFRAVLGRRTHCTALRLTDIHLIDCSNGGTGASWRQDHVVSSSGPVRTARSGLNSSLLEPRDNAGKRIGTRGAPFKSASMIPSPSLIVALEKSDQEGYGEQLPRSRCDEEAPHPTVAAQILIQRRLDPDLGRC